MLFSQAVLQAVPLDPENSPVLLVRNELELRQIDGLRFYTVTMLCWRQTKEGEFSLAANTSRLIRIIAALYIHDSYLEANKVPLDKP